MLISCQARGRCRLGDQAAGQGQMSLRYAEPRMAFESPRYPSLLVSDSRKGRDAYLVSVPLPPILPCLALHSASQRAVGSAVPIQELACQRRGPGSRQREQASPERTSGQQTGGHASGQVKGGLSCAGCMPTKAPEWRSGRPLAGVDDDTGRAPPALQTESNTNPLPGPPKLECVCGSMCSMGAR